MQQHETCLASGFATNLKHGPCLQSCSLGYMCLLRKQGPNFKGPAGGGVGDSLALHQKHSTLTFSGMCRHEKEGKPGILKGLQGLLL